MRIFSHRERPVHLGPYAMERLPRSDGPAVLAETAWSRSDAGGERAIWRVMGDYAALYDSLRDGDVAPQRAPISQDPERRARDLKAHCYFLDAQIVGTTRIPGDAWRGAAVAEHAFALVIAIEYAKDPAPGAPGDDWLTGAQDARADLRAGEIATIMAGYIRHLGYPARAHSASLSEVDLPRLAIAAGIAETGPDGALRNPFLGRRFRLAAVTTTFEIAADRPLARRRLGDGWRVWGPGYWLGAGGAKPGWRRLNVAARPLHLGPYPMEKIDRVPETTTLITDEVPRVPKRANFFTRCLNGDFGPKAQRERNRFAFKTPYAQGYMPLIKNLVPMQDGPVADERAPGTDDPATNANDVKAAGYFLGADMVGICAAPAFAYYSHELDGTPIAPYHKYAIVMLIDQGYETMEGASGDDWISGAQSMRAYMRGAEIAGVLAAQVRSLGYSAKSHTNADSDVLHIPLILLAGLGELSRIGELVLNPFVGPRFKSVVVTTDMPLAPDRPIDFGLQDFCDQCMKCARECPCDAISFGDKIMFNGYEMWKPDVEKCVRYRVTNPKGSACGRCMKMCPYNSEGLLVHRLFLWAAIKLPFTRQWIAILDDKVGNGRRNPAKRWWYDLEIVDDVAVAPPLGTNERDLDLDRVVDPAKQKLAIYPADTMPPPDSTEPVPVDRKAGMRRAAEAEKAADARARVS